MNKIYLFLVFSILMISCQKKPKHKYSNEITIDLLKADASCNASIFIDTMYSIKLKLGENHVWGIPQQVLFSTNRIYVLDKRQRKVFMFSDTGDFISQISKKGNGPGEYTSLQTIDLYKDNFYILDIAKRKIIKYDFDGNYVNDVTFPFSHVIDDFMALPDDNFLCYCPRYMENGQYGVWIMNHKGENIKTILEFDDRYSYMKSNWNGMYNHCNNFKGINHYKTSLYYLLDIEKRCLIDSIKQTPNMNLLSKYSNVESIDLPNDYVSPYYVRDTKEWIFTFWGIPNGFIYSLYSKQLRSHTVFKKLHVDIPGYNDIMLPISTNLPNEIVTCYTNEQPNEMLPDIYTKVRLEDNEAVIQIATLKQ